MSSFKKTFVVAVDPERPDKTAIKEAAKVITLGGLVAFPTETVYGLAADRSDPKAMSRLSKVKDRPTDKHYTVHIADLSSVRKLGCVVTKEARILMKKYWPGPLTIILRSGDGATIGFRMPANKVALALLKEAKVPVVAPSANISGNKPPVDAASVIRGMDGRIDMVIDAGRTSVGVESTVIDLSVSPYRILREGAVSRRSIASTLQKGRGLALRS